LGRQHALENAKTNFALVVWRHENLPAIAAALGFPPLFDKWPQEDYATWWALSHDFDYYWDDNAFYRARHGTGLAAVDDVWADGAWGPYRGDPGRPYCYGSKIPEAALPPGAAA
jgi:hypothetical protein